ncbi:exopolyphosphatase [Desulfobotulus sp.]|jgi:exopolyphosphatase/guanosine-5'-triphosphate,3'-diphosphate pyrophosphatase|uniref:Ppx/GppA phosphatase family protein n=1 Tax=Desulfobotulus sp. TaxID=1940337 RepID=UPI002A35E8F4|nr:exopolyphosphatase [Desulfobotulus sp.]MDY0163658.1 exopolyphosphatase [Desulfobotulus sp.]
MMTGKRFAAMDIGSNAVRLLLTEVFEGADGPCFRKIALVRMPIRLGRDAFILGKISKENGNRLLDTIKGFRSLIRAYEPLRFRACATSAMREAANGEKIRKKIFENTGVSLEIIEGREEARIIFANNPWNGGALPGKEESWIFVDVGGGSTEITLFSRGESLSRSFAIGTVRLLENLVPEESWEEMKAWLREHTRDLPGIQAVGSGGNINSVMKLAKGTEGRVLTMEKMKAVREQLRKFPYEERVTKLGLKPDRADVILPALKIYLSVMKWSGAEKMSVPQIGLADGIVRLLYQEEVIARSSRVV